MLKGERVTLRALTPSDYPRLVEFKNDVEVELLGGGRPPRPVTLEGLTEFFAEVAKNRDDINFAIDVDGVFIGDIGLHNVNRINGTGELGIGIGDRTYWSKGYGREAIGLLVDYAFTIQNLRRVFLQTYSNNPRAIACYRACGFVEEGRMREHVWSGGSYVDEVIMGRLRDSDAR